MSSYCCSCISDQSLDLYALGQLPAAEAIDLEEHLLVCQSCRQSLTDVDRFIAAFRTADAILDPNGPAMPKRAPLSRTRLPHRSALLFAAALTLLALLPVIRSSPPVLPVGIAALVTVRDAGAALPVVSRARQTELVLDLSRLAPQEVWRVAVVDSTGSVICRTDARAIHDKSQIRIDGRLRPGTYWVRVYDAGPTGELVREYGFRVR